MSNKEENQMVKKIVLCALLVCLPVTPAFPATLTFLNGNTIEAKLVEVTDEYIMVKLDTSSSSFPVKFYKEELKNIEISKNEGRIPLSNFSEQEILEGAISRLTDIYYLDPNTNLLIPHLELVLNRDPRIVTLPEKWDHVSHFYATAFQTDKDKISELEKLMAQFTGSAQKAVRKIIADTQYYVPVKKVNDPKDMDFLWAEFIATGKEEPVRKIIETLDYTINDFSLNTPYWEQYELSESDRELALESLRRSAKWSLEANAKKHKRVYEIIKDRFEENGSKELKEILRRTKVKITEQNWIEELLKRTRGSL